MDKYGQKKTIKMKTKLINKLNYFVRKVNSGEINTGLCRDVVSKVKSYVETTETELSNRELDAFTEIRNNEPLRMMLIMSGIYLPLIIEDDTIRFLFNNPELRVKNQKYSLTLMLCKLQNLIDFTYFHAKDLGIYRQVFTVSELKELQKEINDKWKK